MRAIDAQDSVLRVVGLRHGRTAVVAGNRSSAARNYRSMASAVLRVGLAAGADVRDGGLIIGRPGHTASADVGATNILRPGQTGQLTVVPDRMAAERTLRLRLRLPLPIPLEGEVALGTDVAGLFLIH
jgi:hypothetical protein